MPTWADLTLSWRTMPHSGKLLAESPAGLITVALRRAAGRSKMWTATLPDGRRLASTTDALSCQVQAEAQVARLAVQ